MKRYRKHYIDLSWLLKKLDNPTAINSYVRRRFDMYHWDDEVPPIDFIERTEHDLINHFSVLYTFKETIEDLQYASMRRLGSVELEVHMSAICDSHITENIRMFKAALEQTADQLSRWGEKILFKPTECENICE